MESHYFSFEEKLFDQHVQNTAKLVEETSHLMNEIDDQMDKITQELIKVKQEVASVAPQNRDHIDRLNKINNDIAVIEKGLEYADECMDRND